ncbi:ankyrin repeat domain-containing protein SOWAHC [Hippoglossus stenolepis]|uniref:ankyrin repeat domain-containing protein SOWAHC n=1 Tax=Hippoglossus stenolepis TaxID=195615 RepID=UPI001FAEBF5F|nr:ankyrin repeat domain-containing protein SOWAHC [Hippoglossus stenolepis]
MGDVSEDALLDYFCSRGGNSGKVRNADIMKTFKPFIGHGDAQLRAKYREEFKLIIDRIAVVKSENGEKFLVLKKKYRQQLQERDARHHDSDGDGQRRQSPSRTAAAAQWDSSPHQHERRDERASRGEEQRTGAVTRQLPPPPVIHIQVPSEPSNGDEELDKDSGSKSESEQDEEGTGSLGSAAVALDPIEKEWIYSAAGARVPDLSQLLRQDPSLANKKDFTSFTALHWAAKHGNEDMAALVVNAGADVNTKSVSGYTALHIAALHGHRHILDLLLRRYGAKENLRDYSGHLAFHYLNVREPEGPEEEIELPELHVTQARERNRNRKLVTLFHSKKKWGSAEELAPIEEEERTPSHQLVPLPFRPRKFSR